MLSDERKRMAYDELGPRDFEQGQQLLTAEVDSAAKLRARFEREKRRVAEQAYHGKLRMSGSLVVGASARACAGTRSMRQGWPLMWPACTSGNFRVF